MAEEPKNCLAAGMPLSVAAISSQLDTVAKFWTTALPSFPKHSFRGADGSGARFSRPRADFI